jgi:glutathione synthase/RimK-type ligase-like ATP-grasp enzyme
LVTNDPALVHNFLGRCGRVIYKSISGVRSIVQTLGEQDLRRLERIRWCPTQFQEFVEGCDVRVHVVGEAVFATLIRTEATDYRYARQQVNAPARLVEVDISDEVAGRCVALTKGLGLEFAGIDLKVTPDKRVYCFEVNPSPAFSYYEAHTDQPISMAVARHLAGA